MKFIFKYLPTKNSVHILYSLFFFFSPLLWRGVGGEVFAQQCNIIYVTPTGANSGAAGTQATPASLPYAFTLANATNNQLWLAVGNYTISNELAMIGSITMEGGFDPANNWKKTNSQQTIITRDATNMGANPNRITAVECTAISNFGIYDITIITNDAVGSSVSTYGIHVSNSSSYNFSRLTITAGNATDGGIGVAGANGVNGANGTVGQPGDEDGGCCTGGGAGGSGSYPGSSAGGNGGDGGARGTGICFGIGGTAPNGLPGQVGQGTGGGTGGVGGQGMCNLPISFGCDQTPASIGTAGADGTDGANGANGANGIISYAAYFTPGDGQDGIQGDNGGGGGGGGGGGSQGCLNTCFGNNNGAGPGGSGGGEGGQGGFGATGGKGGGGSFAVYVDANGANTYLKDAVLNSGLQGIGGQGGTPGGTGGGSSGGAVGFVGCDIGAGGAGGNGGKGGNGGIGGNGLPGASLPLYEDPAGTALAQSDMKATVEPAIFVQNTGCTFSDINYTTNATGIIQWFFDGGAVPLSDNGDSALTQYTTFGRHSITLVVDGVPYMFTDFVGMFSDGTPYLPTITGPDTVCPGASATFSETFPSVFAVQAYEWKIYDGANVVTATTPTVSHTFNTIGTYNITLQTTSPCCGKSKIDTFVVNVVPYLNADVFVSASSSKICNGEPATFFAVPVNGGTNPTYQWNVNGTNTGVTTNSFTSSTFNNGDIITCIMTSSYPCPLNSPATSLPFTITVNPLPTATCSTTGAYLGANTAFTATPAGGTAPYVYNWDFGDGGIDTAAAPTHLFGGTGTYTYSVSVTDSNGCTGVCTNTVNIIIAPYVYAGFTYNATPNCGSTTVTFTDTTKGNPTSWQWNFGDNSPVSNLQNPTHLYTAPGDYSVILIAGNGVFSDTALRANIIPVWIVPSANLSYITDTICYPLNAQFFDVSSGAAAWQWDFGDGNPSSTLQNPSHSYSDSGTYNVTLIVSSINGCTDTAYGTVYVLPQPTALFIQSDTAICSGDSVQFFADTTNAVQWYWNFGDGNTNTGSTSLSHTYDNAGIYNVSLIVENVLGCTDTFPDNNAVTVDVKQQPTALFEPDTTTIIFPDNDIALTNYSANYTSWLWDFGNQTLDSTNFNATAVYTDSGVYTIWLYAIYELGCRDSMSIEVTVIDVEAIYVPNAFSPDADGNNDVFYVYGNNLTEVKFYVFDRWGATIFQSSDMSLEKEGKYAGWDGKVKGERVPDGVYPYRIDYKIKSTKSRLHTKIGSLLMLGKK